MAETRRGVRGRQGPKGGSAREVDSATRFTWKPEVREMVVQTRSPLLPRTVPCETGGRRKTGRGGVTDHSPFFQGPDHFFEPQVPCVKRVGG